MRSTDPPDTSANPPEPFRLSAKWDMYIPFTITAIPACLFALLGLVFKCALNGPAGQPSIWFVNMIVVIQTLGIIAMAFVILMRYEIGFQELFTRTNGRPAIWRKLFLLCSIALVLLFDILTNLAVAIPDADLVLVPAALAFIGYIVCVHVAFLQL
jgi:hypothetical protein